MCYVLKEIKELAILLFILTIVILLLLIGNTTKKGNLNLTVLI